MAFDTEKAEHYRNAIGPAGLLTHTFDPAVGEIHRLTKEENSRNHNYQLVDAESGDLSHKSHIAVGSGPDAGKNAALTSKENERRKKESSDHLIFMILMDRLNQLQEKIAWLSDEILVAEDILTRIQNGEKFEVGPDGSLKDKGAERLVQEYEKRTGQKVDRNDPDALYDAIHSENEHMWTKRKGYDAEHKRLEDIRERIENATSPEERQKIFKESGLDESAAIITRTNSIKIKTQGYEELGLSGNQSKERLVMEKRDVADFDMDSMFEPQFPISAATNHSGETSIKNDKDIAIEFAKASTDEQPAQPEEKTTLAKSSTAENLNFRSN